MTRGALFVLFFSALAAVFIPSTHAAQEVLAVSDLLKTKLQSLPGKLVVLQIWSPFCEPCGQEVRELNQAIAQTSGEFSVLGVPVSGRDREINAFIRHFNPLFEQWKPDATFKAYVQKTSMVTPQTLLINQNFRILKSWIGKITAIDLLKEIRIINLTL